MDIETLKRVVCQAITTCADEISCAECYELLDEYADVTLADRDAAGHLPHVHNHLERCADCREEWSGLLAALQATFRHLPSTRREHPLNANAEKSPMPDKLPLNNLNLNLPTNVGLELRRRDKVLALLSFVIPAVLVIALLLLLVYLRKGAESAMAQLASLLPFGYAFSAGMVASVNPCGFLLLPSYLMYYLGLREGETDQQIGRRAVRGLALGAVAALGFVVVFAATGSIVAAGGIWLNVAFPYARGVIGLAMLVLGVWLLVSGKTLGISAAKRLNVAPKRNIGNVFLFGIVYAVGSLSCTLPIFLVVVGSALAAQAWLQAIGQFISYALGMATVFTAITVAAALLRQVVTYRLHGIVHYVNRFSALLLVGAGGYLIYDWIAQTWLT